MKGISTRMKGISTYHKLMRKTKSLSYEGYFEPRFNADSFPGIVSLVVWKMKKIYIYFNNYHFSATANPMKKI